MVQGYYTLEEAARILGMDAERLNQMAQKREIRAFADRGTWRFRTQDVDEMARRLGMGSSPDLQLGEAPRSGATPTPRSGGKSSPSPSPKASPAPGPKSGPRGQGEEGVFDFSLGNTPAPMEMEHEIVIESPSSQKLGGAGSRGSSISPAPKPGSDSDVHLVFDAGNDASALDDSNVRLEEGGPPSSSSGLRKPPASLADSGKSGIVRRTPGRTGSQLDSGVRLVPMDDDSSLPLGEQSPISGTDSDIRLAPKRGAGKNDVGRAGEGSAVNLGHSTEDINLDEELKKAEDLARSKKPRSKVKPKSDPNKTADISTTSSSDFEIDPAVLEQPARFDDNDQTAELRLDSDEEAALGELEGGGEVTGSTNVAGINLHSPADSGVNLAKERDPSSDSLEFELSLEPEGTPAPAIEAPEGDSSSEFELTLEDAGAGSEDASASGEQSAEPDIFETDFEMPALEESDSEGSALETGDTELESSDFDLSLGDEESGSQVVALEGEEADEGAATVAYRGRREDLVSGETGETGETGLEEPEEIDELLGDESLESEYEEVEGATRLRRQPVVTVAPTPEWGVLPAVVMFPCVIIMFLLCCMGYELLNNMWGYKQANRPTAMLVKTFAGWFGEKVPE